MPYSYEPTEIGDIKLTKNLIIEKGYACRVIEDDDGPIKQIVTPRDEKRINLAIKNGKVARAEIW